MNKILGAIIVFIFIGITGYGIGYISYLIVKILERGAGV